MARHSGSQAYCSEDTSPRRREVLFLEHINHLGAISKGDRCLNTSWLGRQDCSSVSFSSVLSIYVSLELWQSERQCHRIYKSSLIDVQVDDAYLTIARIQQV